MINTPGNPTGKVFNRTELEAIAHLCQKWNALAITDEIYEHILYTGEHVPLATLPGMRDRTVTISGASKTYGVTGWRVGWAIAPAWLTNPIRKVHDFLTVGAPAPLQAQLPSQPDCQTSTTGTSVPRTRRSAMRWSTPSPKRVSGSHHPKAPTT